MQRVKATVDLPNWAIAWIKRRNGELSDSIDALLKTHYIGRPTREAVDKLLARGESQRVTIQVDQALQTRAKLRKMTLSAWLSERLAIGWLLSQTDHSLTGKFQSEIAKEMGDGLSQRDKQELDKRVKGKARV